MRISVRPSCLCIGTLLAVLAACAADAPRENAALEAKWSRTVAALTAAGDADSLAAAAVLDFRDSARQLALLARAVALASDRADLVWLEIRACSRTDGCDATPYVQALHVLDPDNGAAWVPLLDQATHRNDAEALRRYLTAVGAAKRFDIYWNTSIVHLTRALIKVQADDARTALTSVIGLESVIAIPTFKNISSACKGDALQDPARLATCRGIAGALRSGDTYLVEMIGTRMAQRVWPEGSAEYDDAARARRLARYRLHVEGQLEWVKLRRNREALELLRLMDGHRTEQELDEAIIVGAAVSPMPPADWKDPKPGES